jgi:serine/threonine protein kinase
MVEGLESGDPQWAGPYRLVGRLGNGGMGQVFLGRSAGGRPVAVKVIRADLAGDVNFRARFRQEVAAARKVSGLFTALVVDADPDGPRPWLATAYVAGPSLAEAVTSHGNLPAETVLALAAGLAEGLQAVHAAGVVHRDLKPSNVLLADDGPRVIDFGISRAAEASALTHTGMVVGSPGFMSPEQAEGGEVGPPSDMFSLGAVLTFAATGEGPFGTGSTAALIYRVVHGRPKLDDLPAEVRPLVERCLAKDPGGRPTAGEVLAELSGTALTADWLPEQVVRDLPLYAVSDADPGAAADTGDSPGPGAGESSPVPAAPDVPPTVTAVAASPGPAQVSGPPLPGGVSRNRLRGGRRRLALAAAAAAVILAASAVAAFALDSSPAAGHPRLAAGSAPAASSSLTASHAPASHPAASRHASASPDRSPSVRASRSVKPTTAGPTPQAGSGNAPAAPAVPAPQVLTSVSSAFAPQGGYVFVEYEGGADASAQVSGQVTNAASGEVARLYAQQFPFTSSPALAGSAALDPSGTTAQYTFAVTPTLATRYAVEVFRDSTAGAPLATSATITIYVVMGQPGDNTYHCSGSQCEASETVTVDVPASALSTQMSEHVYTYFAINYAKTVEPPGPTTLQLGGGDPTVSTPQQISADEYQFTLTFSYSSNDEAWHTEYRHCTISMEAQDGIGLPGSGDYGCGNPTIQDSWYYLG